MGREREGVSECLCVRPIVFMEKFRNGVVGSDLYRGPIGKKGKVSIYVTFYFTVTLLYLTFTVKTVYLP